MRVWIVDAIDWEDSEILGVYATKELALRDHPNASEDLTVNSTIYVMSYEVCER
jgi:hypothetical protein